MSYEGYVQTICQKGHYMVVDAYEFDESKFICPWCKSGLSEWNGVDDTNGDGLKYTIVPILATKPKHCICKDCGHKHCIVQATYRFPKNSGAKKVGRKACKESSLLAWGEHLMKKNAKGKNPCKG